MNKEIKKLVDVVNRNQEERDKDKKAEEIRNARQSIIDSALDEVVTEFWCVKCQKDFARHAHKQTLHYEEPCAFYEAKCPGCSLYARRYITDKHLDPYYHQSKTIKRQRVEMERDFLQPGDPRFNRIYGDPNKKHYEELEKKEREAWERKRQST